MFFIFPVLSIIALLKIRNRLANIPKLFSKTCIGRDSLKMSFSRLWSFFLGRGSNLKGFKAKASSTMETNGNFLVTLYSIIVVGSGILSELLSFAIRNLLLL